MTSRKKCVGIQMKTVKLTQAEIDVILTALEESSICRNECYCGYKSNYTEDRCHVVKKGKPACKLRQLIDSIVEKIST